MTTHYFRQPVPEHVLEDSELLRHYLINTIIGSEIDRADNHPELGVPVGAKRIEFVIFTDCDPDCPTEEVE